MMPEELEYEETSPKEIYIDLVGVLLSYSCLRNRDYVTFNIEHLDYDDQQEIKDTKNKIMLKIWKKWIPARLVAIEKHNVTCSFLNSHSPNSKME